MPRFVALCSFWEKLDESCGILLGKVWNICGQPMEHRSSEKEMPSKDFKTRSILGNIQVERRLDMKATKPCKKSPKNYSGAVPANFANLLSQ